MAIVLSAMLLLSGCSAPKEEISEMNADVIQSYTKSIDEIVYPNEKKIVALGEATHGNKELIELKQIVFEKMLEQGRNVFVIEGDFGGGYRVNEYIAGAEGNAKDAVAEIGFRIYRSRDLENILEFMRKYNEGKAADEQIRFYGMDMQRYDNNKEILLEILSKAGSSLEAEYRLLLEDFSDETMYDIKKDRIEKTLSELERSNEKLEEEKESIIAKTSAKEFDIAKHVARVIWQNTMLRNSSDQYGTLRDRFMAENTLWILAHEQEFHDNDKIFLTGHNGHLSKMSAIFGTEKVMGEILSGEIGDDYFVIGTEFGKSRFIARDEKTNELTEFSVENTGKGRLATLLTSSEQGVVYFDIAAAAGSGDEQVKSYLDAGQSISAVGESFSKSYEKVEQAYVQKLSPAKSFDGIIFFDGLTPFTIG